jgi:uncharacterized membrane protein YccC
LAIDLLDWSAKQLKPTEYDQPMDAPFTARVLRLDEACINAIAERPALTQVERWFRGVPTALLSLQSAVLSLRDNSKPANAFPADRAPALKVLERAAQLLRKDALPDLPTVQEQSTLLTRVSANSETTNPAVNEIASSVLALLIGLEAILTLKRPHLSAEPYPPPKFATEPGYATINLIRTIVAVVVGFAIWDFTAWPHGTVFMEMIAVATVVFVKMEDPVMASSAGIVGTSVGCVSGLAVKYCLLVGESNPLSLVVVVSVAVWMGAWIQTRRKVAPLGNVFVIGFLVVFEPRNPQDYNFVRDINVFIAVVFAFGFVSLVFLAIGAPLKGRERVAALLARMRHRLSRARGDLTRQQVLQWETQMYDQLQGLQAATNDDQPREVGVNLLLNGLRVMSKPVFSQVGKARNKY